MSPWRRLGHRLPAPNWVVALAASLASLCLAFHSELHAQSVPDLVIEKISLNSALARAGDVVTGTVTVRNAGTGAADTSTIGIYLAPRINTPLGTSTALGTVAVGGLAARASVELPLSVQVPAVGPGHFYVVAQADVVGKLGEASESNNRAVARLEVRRADLVVTSLAVFPSMARAGDTVDVTATVTNAGLVPSEASSLGVFFAASLTSAGQSGSSLGTVATRPLAPGASVSLPLRFTVPAVAAGSFYVVALADFAGTISETSNANNRGAARFQVARPDLVVDAVELSSATAQGGDEVNVRVRVRNQGRVPAEASEGAVYFVTSPASALQGATPLLTFPVARLTPGASAETVLPLAVPSVAPGSFAVVARADSTGVVAEVFESNNLRWVSLRVDTADLAIASFTATPAMVGIGDTIQGVISLRNRGLAVSKPTTATLYLASTADADLTAATHVATVPVPPVAARRSNTLGIPVIVPPLPQGDQYLIVQMDAQTASSPLHRAPASLSPVLAALASNPRTAARFTLSYPDLVITRATTGSAQVQSGGSVAVTLTIANRGDVGTPVSTASLFLADSASASTDDLAGTTVPVGPLARRASATLTVSLPVSARAAGRYFVIAEADWLKEVAESNDGNNRAFASLQVTASAPSGSLELEPQVDPSQLDMPWPKHSHYKHPWKAWLETVPAHVYRSGVGITYDWTKRRENDAVEMRLLSEVGFARVRVEVGWNTVDYDTLDLKPDARAKLTSIVAAARSYGIRPLILLNSNHGEPAPFKTMVRTVAAAAGAGSRTLRLDDVTGIRTSYTGLSNLSDYKMAEVLVTAVNAGTRTVTLAKPLPVALRAGQQVTLNTLRYQPLSEPGTAAFEETVDGWVQYARAVLRAVNAAGISDFDVEIWNELTFGSDFLYVNRYYDPPMAPEVGDIWRGERGWELARRTIVMMAAEFPRALPIWGYSNITFFGVPITDLPPGTRGQTYHPYFFLNYRSIADEQYGFEQNLEGFAPSAPPYRVLMPEAGGMFVKTESIARLINPAARQERPSGSTGFDHYMTEFGLNPAEFGVTDVDTANQLKAKTALRSTLFWLNKGLRGIWLFGDLGEGDLSQYDLLPFAITTLDRYPSDPSVLMTPPLQALSNVSTLFRTAQPISSPRQLVVEAAAADGEGGGLLFSGAGGHRSLTYQDAFTPLPFQVDATTFVIAFYVMSRNILEMLSDTPFVVRLSNLNGLAAQVRYTDPMTGRDLGVEVLDRTSDSLRVQLPVSDSPYLLVVTENVAD